MRVLVALVSVLLAANTVAAQTQASLEQPPVIQIVKYTWAKERIDWDKNPFGRPTEISDTRSRRGSILEERHAREAKKDKEKPSEPPRYVFNYKVTVVNGAAKAISEIDWDYVFTDAATGEELGRREFTSVEKISAGKRKELSVVVSSPPVKRISVYSLGKREREGMMERVEIRRILYEDGTVGQTTDARVGQ